ncbi:MAG TPA: cupredoxin family copper-binding protein [Steroidobacteraceae bacterium]|jgi:plastocyanin|nr:cupredoxin family copper-binding protein [Steroidobacteraceae bacterium]
MLTIEATIDRMRNFNISPAVPGARRRAFAAALCACGLLALASGSVSLAAEPAAAPNAALGSIAIRNFMFEPMSLAVAVGTTVTWKNFDGEPHTIHSIDDTFRSGALDQNDSFSFKFDKPGTYRYACSIHPQMVATIVVK